LSRSSRLLPFLILVSGWKPCPLGAGGGGTLVPWDIASDSRSALVLLVCTSVGSHLLVAGVLDDGVSVIPVKAVAWSGNTNCSLAVRGRSYKPRPFHFFIYHACAVFFSLGLVLFFFPVLHCKLVTPACFVPVILVGWGLC
jgi:hypothetical protein